jgi:hypothetical protein
MVELKDVIFRVYPYDKEIRMSKTSGNLNLHQVKARCIKQNILNDDLHYKERGNIQTDEKILLSSFKEQTVVITTLS